MALVVLLFLHLLVVHDVKCVVYELQAVNLLEILWRKSGGCYKTMRFHSQQLFIVKCLWRFVLSKLLFWFGDVCLMSHIPWPQTNTYESYLVFVYEHIYIYISQRLQTHDGLSS